MKLELADIDKEMKNSEGQIESLKNKILQEEKQLEQLTQASDAAKVTTRARSETVYAGMVYRHFFGRLEIIPPVLSGRLPYRYDCQENH